MLVGVEVGRLVGVALAADEPCGDGDEVDGCIVGLDVPAGVPLGLGVRVGLCVPDAPGDDDAPGDGVTCGVTPRMAMISAL